MTVPTGQPPRPIRRVLVAGAKGMLGTDVVAELTRTDAGREPFEVTAWDREELDLTDAAAVSASVTGFDAVVNCAAWTAVDDAETKEAAAFMVNAVAPANLATACAAAGIPLVHISTDYVFAGDATQPYAEDAPIAPKLAYGRTKAAGEWAVRAHLPTDHWILRTAWLYGSNGPSFVRTMARLEASRPTLKVVEDEHGQPTWTRDLAARIAEVLVQRPPAGTYHATSSGRTTWFGFARRIFELLGADPQRVEPTTAAEFARPAPRPPFSVLGHDAWAAAGMAPLRAWDDALAAAMAETDFRA
ncbi:MAG: dTDP-4-dehydrorhamnose reductase [Kineosporiaceae bacterium]